MLKLYLLGFPRIEVNGQAVKMDRRKALALLIYLAMEQRPLSRETLATLFWGDYDQSKAFAYLRRELWTLNSELSANYFEIDRETVRLAESVWIDALEFLSLTEQAKQQPEMGLSLWRAAVELYQDRFLAGFTLRDCPDFDDWQYLQSEMLHREMLNALAHLTRIYATRQQPQEGMEYTQRWLALDPYDESAHRGMIKFYAMSGQRNAALRQYEECVRLLKEEFDTDPQPETTRLYQELQQSQSIPRNLPPQTTGFVGRQKELAEIHQLFENPACRLITIVGPGGIGKTRLVIEAGKQSKLPVYFVSLVGITSTELIIPAIAEAVEFNFEQKQEQKKQLFEFLADKRWLLILDNFEQLLDGAMLLTELLEIAPELRLMITSRERLNFQSEWVLALEGMDFPEDIHRAQALENYGAVQLFIQHSRKMGYTPAKAEMPPIVKICQMVDGMPLGIELAATWTKMLSIREIAQEIQKNVDFLTSSLRDTPERHRSLRAVFEHSWNLMSENERTIFRRLSIFRGDFQREAAAQIIPATLMQLTSLVDKSLLRRNPDGSYEVHELLRQYAAEKLAAEPDEARQVKSRFSTYYLDFVHLREKRLFGHSQKQIFREISREMENVRAAWDWAVEEGDWSKIQAALSLLEFFDMHELPYEAAGRFGVALEKLRSSQELTPEMEMLLGRMLAGYAWFGSWLGYIDAPTARQYIQESITLAEKHGNKKELAFSWLALGNSLQYVDHNYEEAAESYRRSYALYEEIQEHYWMASVLAAFGMLADLLGKYDESLQHYQEMLRIYRMIGDSLGTAMALVCLTNVTRLQGQFEESRSYALEAVALFREMNHPNNLSNALANLGLVYKATGDYGLAEEVCLEALTLCEDDRFSRERYASVLNNLGVLARLKGDYEKAARLHRQTRDIFREHNNLWGLGFSQNDLGTALHLMGRHQEALHLHEDSLRVCQSMSNRYDIAESLQRKGQIYTVTGQYDRAELYLKEALQIAHEIKVIPLLIEILSHLGILYLRQEDDRALEILSVACYAPGSEFSTRQHIQALKLPLPAPQKTLEQVIAEVCELKFAGE